MKRALLFCAAAILSAGVGAGEWSYDIPGASNLKAAITPLKYGKTWSYSLEFDDSAVGPMKVFPDLAKDCLLSDAPPGYKGGNPLPLVANPAVCGYTFDARGTEQEKLRGFLKQGWGVNNHGYFHHPSEHWGAKDKTSPLNFAIEMLWSQSVIGQTAFDGAHAPYVFTAPYSDAAYIPYIEKNGIPFGSRHGEDDNAIAELKYNDFRRYWMDSNMFGKEGDWEADYNLPSPKMKNYCYVEFTHGITPNKKNKAYKGWAGRFKLLARKFGNGEKGKNNLWPAATGDVARYVKGAKEAAVKVSGNRIIVSWPDSMLKTPLTIRVTGIPEGVKLNPPDGGLVYQSGGEAYITTPELGVAVPKMPYTLAGETDGAKNGSIQFEKPIRCAGFRLAYLKEIKPSNDPKIVMITPDGKSIPYRQKLPDSLKQYNGGDGVWALFPILPIEKEPITVKEIKFERNPGYGRFQVWQAND